MPTPAGHGSAGSVAERAAEFRSKRKCPTRNDLIPLYDAARLIELAFDMALNDASQFLVKELAGPYSHFPLWWVYAGERIVRVIDDRVPMEPEAIPAGWTCTHYPSERDRLLGDLGVALVLGNVIGDPSTPATRQAAALHLLLGEFVEHFVNQKPLRPRPSNENESFTSWQEEAEPKTVEASNERLPAVHWQKDTAQADPGIAGGKAASVFARPLELARDPTAERARRDAEASQFKPTRERGEDWTVAHLTEFLRQYDALIATGPGSMKAVVAKEHLAAVWGLAPNSVHATLTRARRAQEPAQAKRRCL